jgi:hypothetical protein
LIPLNIPNYNEFAVEIVLDIGFSIDHIWGEWLWYWHYFDYYEWWPWSCYCWKRGRIKVWYLSESWRKLWGAGIDFEFRTGRSYKTPLVNERSAVPLGELDILGLISDALSGRSNSTTTSVPTNILSVVATFIRAGIGFDLTLHGNPVYAKLNLLTGTQTFSRGARWGYSGEKQSMSISGSATAKASSLEIRVTNFVYSISKITLNPYLFVGLRNINLLGFTIPLADWIPPLKIYLFSISLPGFTIASNAIYKTSGPSVLTAGNYNFNVNVKKVPPRIGQGADGNIDALDHVYSITIDSVQRRTDTISLSVTGLPTGYRAVFFPQSVRLDLTAPKKALLVIYSPDRITLPPGTIYFNIIATSKIKQTYNLGTPSISKVASFNVPQIIDFTLKVKKSWYGPIEVKPNQEIQVEFDVTNRGNIADTIKVDAALYTSDQTRTWTSSLLINPSTIASDKFKFKFSIDDIYPSPGIYKMVIKAQSQTSPIHTKWRALYFNFTAAYAFETTLTPKNITIEANWATNFKITVQNLGNTIDDFSLVLNAPSVLEPYLNLPNKIIDVASKQSDDAIITLEITDPKTVPAGLYDLRVTVLSDGLGDNSIFSTNDFQLNILPFDKVPPHITYIGPLNESEPIIFPRSPSLDLGLSWKAYDENQDIYEVYINDNLITTNTWINDVPIQVPVTGSNDLSVGLYNVTIVFSDGYNVALDQKWVRILPEDTVTPIVVPNVNEIIYPQNFFYQQELKWNCREKFLLNATLYLNDVIVPYTDYTIEKDAEETENWITKLTVNPNTLTQGVWNYTLEIQDQSNNVVTSTILLNVTAPDTSIPLITEYPTTSANQNHDELISVVATDNYPDRYELIMNSTSRTNGTWESNIPITFKVDDYNLSLGPNEIEIYIYDLVDNYNYYKWTLTLIDVDTPLIITSSADESTAYEHMLSPFYAPTWQLYDLNPGTYEILRDSILVEEGIWQLGNNTIYMPISNLSVGEYHYEAYFSDSSGNTQYSSINLTVSDTLEPYIFPLDPVFFEPMFVADWFEFFILEPHLSGYELYRNDTLIDENSITSNFPVVLVTIGELTPGVYNYTLKVRDESENIGKESVLVTVADYTPPLIKTPPDLVYSEGETGHEIIWEIQELNPHKYSIYLDDALVESNNLTTNLSLSVDGLELGIHKYVLLVNDQAGLSHSSISYVLVVDMTTPQITHIADCQFKAGDENAILEWQVTEIHPESYKILRNGISLIDESWDGSIITLPLVGWSKGTHTLQLNVKDTSGNIAIDTVQITILEEETTTTLSQISAEGPGFELIYVLMSISLLGGLLVIKRRKRSY